MSTVRHSFKTVAQCNISVSRSGTGEKLLFLHGQGGASRWAPFMEQLASRFDVIVPEHPGFGRSATPDWLDDIADLAYFYLDFIRQERLSDLHLVGTSVGGWLAAEIAIRDSSALKSLTLVAPAGLHVPGVATTDIFMTPPQELMFATVGDPGLARQLLDHQPSDEELEERVKNALAMARIAWQPRLYNPNLAKWLHRIEVPTHLIWGDQDRILPLAYAEKFRSLLPHAELTVLPGCGHLPHLEAPERYVQTVADFITRV